MNGSRIVFIAVSMIWMLSWNANAISTDRRSKFSGMSVEEAEQVLNSAEGYQFRFDYASEALQSRRMDLINLCFENQYTMGAIRNGVVALPDSVFKDQLVILMLRGSKAWPSEESKSYWSRFSGGLVREPFVSVLKKHFPNMLLNDSLLDNRADRLRLADDLEKAIAKAPVQPTANRTGAVSASPPAESPSTPLPTEQVLEASPEAIALPEVFPTTESQPECRSWAWLFVGLVVAGIVGLLWRRRKARDRC